MTEKRSFDINRQKIEEPSEIESSQTREAGHFNWQQASITIGLAIIALWSAYFVTKLLAGKTTALDTNATKKISTSAPVAPPKQDTSKTSTDTTPVAKDNPFKPLADDTSKATDTPATDSSSIPAKDSFTVRILNGNGIVGDAAKVKTDLTTQGFKISTIGNAKLKYDKTEIYYLSGKQKEADLLKSALSGRQIEVKEADSGLIGDGNDILLVIGKS